MISFYDWAPAELEGCSHGERGDLRGSAAGGARSRPAASACDEEALADPEIQARICEKIQHAVDISDVFNKVAIHSARASPKTLVFAAHRIARYCRLRRQDTSTTRRAARWSSLLAGIQRGLQALDAQAITDTTWALAVVLHREPRLLSSICHRAFESIEAFAPANLAITAWSFATLAYRDDLVMKRINRQVLERLAEFETQSLANSAWALATMRFKDDVLMQHIAREALRKMSEFTAQHLANASWAYATLGRRAGALFSAMETQALNLLADTSVDFCPLDLALCAWSFAWLEHAGSRSPLLQAMAPVALARLPEFSTQQLANMLWGFDHADYQDRGFFEAVGAWCCGQPRDFWARAAGEELVSVLTALRPHAAHMRGWQELEALLCNGKLRPLADFLREANTHDGYSQGLKKLRTYHAGALYTGWLLQELGFTYMGDGNDLRNREKVEDLLAFYQAPPEPRWLPDGYEDDDVQANRAEIPALLELLDVKRRVQPSSHFIALHLSAELSIDAPSLVEEDGAAAAPPKVRIWRAVPAKPQRRSGLSFVRGVKFDDHDGSGDEGSGVLRTSTLRDYQRKHHAEVIALTQLTEVIAEMEARCGPAQAELPRPRARVRGWVQLFVPHYPCSSCTGALVQFAALHPGVDVNVGHDDWRHWLKRLDALWDSSDERHNQLSINARQLRELDSNLGNNVPAAYRSALRSTLGNATSQVRQHGRGEEQHGRGEERPVVRTLPQRQSFY